MQRAISILTAAALLAASPFSLAARVELNGLVYDGLEPAKPDVASTVAAVLGGRDARSLVTLADGQTLVLTRFGAVSQVHRVATPEGVREQLTFLDGAITAVAAPFGGTIGGFALVVEQAGNAAPQIWYYRFADRNAKRISDGKATHSSPVWSKDGRRLVFAGNGRDGRSNDVYLVEPETIVPPRLLIAAGDKSWTPLDWSADGQKLLLQSTSAGGVTSLFTADVTTGVVAAVPFGKTPTDTRGARFAPDGRGIHLIAAYEGEYARLHHVDPVSGVVSTRSDSVAADVDEFAASADGRYLAYVSNLDGAGRLTVVDQIAKNEVAPTALPPGGRVSDLAFDAAGRRLGFTLETATTPRDAWSYDLEKKTVQRVTRSETGALDPARFVQPESLRYPTWDKDGGRPRGVPSFVYKPRTPGPHPVIVLLEGADQQHRPGFDPLVQYLVADLGYAVIAPNVRGSTGYGATWSSLDDGSRRDDAARDVGSLLVWIGLQRDLDRARVTVLGRGAAGGPLAILSLVQYADRLRAGIDMGGSTRRLTNTKSIRRPLLIVHGMNDHDVLAWEPEQLLTSVRAAGGDAAYLAAKDEANSDFQRQSHREALAAAIQAFLARVSAR